MNTTTNSNRPSGTSSSNAQLAKHASLIERLAAWADRQPPRQHPAGRWMSLRPSDANR
ncbi:hypothetical protein [Piscinibacter sakaiensis]|uniref:hypothetical protein n=1 Tax=Piscinibacter sakaiensis TaxID=1547922 RepID=UPI003AAA38A4